MSDDTPTPDPVTARAAFLAAEPSTTWEALMHEGPAVYATVKENYPDRFEALEQAHARWRSAGKPASMVRTSAPVTVPNPRPVPEPVPVEIPDPSAVGSLRDLLPFGPHGFNEFKARHPEAFDRLAAAAGMPVRP